MNENEKRMLHELKSVAKWMRDAACVDLDDNCKCLFDQVLTLKRNSGDYCEVYVELHLVNGGRLTVSNECWHSLLRQQYSGVVFDIENDDPMVIITFTDGQNRFHQTCIPVSAIAWIDTWTEDVDWLLCYNSLPREEVKKFDEFFSL